MANVAVTNTFVALTTIASAQVNQNFTDLVTWLNNRNAGSDTWSNLKVSGTSGNLVDFTSTASTTEVSINNTATDGDPMLTFKLAGSQIAVIGVDDSDSDFLKFATTGITTNVSMQIPTGGAQVQFNAGSASVPGISTIGDANTGLLFPAANVIGFSTDGVERARITSAGVLSISTASVNALLVQSSNSGATNGITTENTSNTASSDARLLMQVAGTSAGDAFASYAINAGQVWSQGLDNSAGDSFVLSASTALGTTNIITAAVAGQINQPLQPSFLVANSAGATDVTGDGTVYTVLWPTEITDQGSNFASNTFTAPVGGQYLLTASVQMINILVGAISRNIRIVTSNRSYRKFESMALAQVANCMAYSVVADMDAGDTATVAIMVDNQAKTVDIDNDATANVFSGSLLN